MSEACAHANNRGDPCWYSKQTAVKRGQLIQNVSMQRHLYRPDMAKQTNQQSLTMFQVTSG